MTEHLTGSMLEILSWMKEHHAQAYTSLDEIAAGFDMSPDQMRGKLQWLQRYECVKRGGRENAGWSITDQGRVRLAEDRFSVSGAFLSPFDRAERLSGENPEKAHPSSVGDGPGAAETGPLDTEPAPLLPFWR